MQEAAVLRHVRVWIGQRDEHRRSPVFCVGVRFPSIADPRSYRHHSGGMSAYRILLLLVSLVMMAGPAQAAQSPVCGESFCLPKGARLVSRESPVRDFVIYRVEANGQRFVVYEGNHPQRRPGSIILTVGKIWPNYLEVSGPCASKENCALRSFTAQIALR